MLAGVRNFQNFLEVESDERQELEDIHVELNYDSEEELQIEEEVLCFSDDFVEEGELTFSMGCTCHSLQLAVNDFIKSSNEASKTVAYGQKLAKKN